MFGHLQNHRPDLDLGIFSVLRKNRRESRHVVEASNRTCPKNEKILKCIFFAPSYSLAKITEAQPWEHRVGGRFFEIDEPIRKERSQHFPSAPFRENFKEFDARFVRGMVYFGHD